MQCRILGLLSVLVSWSFFQDPPGQLNTLLSHRSFYTIQRPRSANQRLCISTWHLADQSAITSSIDTRNHRMAGD